MRKRKVMTAEQHRETGKALKQACAWLNRAIVAASPGNRLAGFAMRRMEKALASLDHARSDFDTAMGHDCPGEFDPRCYFGPVERECLKTSAGERAGVADTRHAGS